MNHYPHFLGDYARDTGHLSLIEHGAYRLMLDACYATEKPLPNDLGALYRICRATSAAERKAVAKIAEEFFPVNGDGRRHNRRVDAELSKAAAYAEAQSERAHKRWQSRGDAGSMPPHMPESSREDANHNHNQGKTRTLSPPEGAFVSFWAAWPKNDRKGAKGKCWAVWRREKFEAIAQQIIVHVERMKTTDGWHRGFVPAPLVYLNERRWEGAEEGAPQPGKLAI